MLMDIDYDKMFALCSIAHSKLTTAKYIAENYDKVITKKLGICSENFLFASCLDDFQDIFDCVMEVAPIDLRNFYLNYEQKVHEARVFLYNKKQKGN